MTIDVSEILSNYSPVACLIIKYIAANLYEASSYDLNEFRAKQGIKHKDMIPAVAELRQFKYPILPRTSQYSSGVSIGLETFFELQLIAMMVKSGEYYDLNLPQGSHYWYSKNEIKGNIVSKLALFLGKGVTPKFTNSDTDDAEINFMIFATISIDDYIGIEKALPKEMLHVYFQDIVYNSVGNFSHNDDIDSIYNRFVAAYPDDIPFRDSLNASRLIETLLISGDIELIPTTANQCSDDGCYLFGTYYLYRGETELAVKYFEMGIKLEKKSAAHILPRFALFNYYYILALVLSPNHAHAKRLNVIYAKKSLTDKYLPAMLLLAKKTGRYSSTILSPLNNRREILSIPIFGLLCSIIENYYHLKAKERLNIDDYSAYSRYKLLTLEVCGALDRNSTKYNALQKELKIDSIISRDIIIPEWELLLNQLLIQDTRSKTDDKTGKLSRIIYLICSSGYTIQPVLQNSKNGGVSWSSGRNIALSTFLKKDVEGMTSTDKSIAGCILSYKTYRGESLSFDVAKTLKYLIGQSNLFLLSNPEVSVEVVEIFPELTVTVSKNSYILTTNVLDIQTSDQVIKETDVRFKVLSLNTKQKNILAVLGKIKVLPYEAKDKLLTLLRQINDLIIVHSDLIDDSSKIKNIDADSRIVIQLIPVGESLKAEMFIKPFTTNAPYCKVGVGAKTIIGVIDGEKCQAIRDIRKEKANEEIIYSEMQLYSDSEPDNASGAFLFDTAESCLQLIDTLRNHSEIVAVEWPEGVRYKLLGNKPIDTIKLSLKQNNNWFDLEGDLNITEDKIISLKQLFECFRQSHGRFINIGENEYIKISDKLKKRLMDIEAVSNVSKNGLRINQYAVSVFDHVKEDGVELKADKNFNNLSKKIEQAQSIDIDVPTTLKASLRDYQAVGYDWMSRLAHWGAGGCLADDMGLGKTVQAIAMMLSVAHKGAIFVVSPASVLSNWEKELNKFAPSLRVSAMNMAANREALIADADKYDVVLSTYGLLVTEQELLATKRWQMVVLDEAHTIKNHETKTSKSSMTLNAEFRLILTGTPIQNHLGEIWNLFQFINPGLLGTIDEFNTKYVVPITHNKDKVCQKRLKQLIAPFLLRRTKNEVLDELPSKTEIVCEVEMSDAELAYYEILRRRAEEILMESSAGEHLKVLAEITKLRMAACNISLVNPEFDFNSSKMKQFVSIAEELIQNDHAALVFSQFTSHLALVRKELDKLNINYLYLDGSTPLKEREKLVTRFQQGESRLFLISLKAGGLGLNLTAADFVIHLDPWWNPAIEDQATDRSYRIGQTRPVTVYRLIAKNTIEEKILRLHATKRDLADTLLEGANMVSIIGKEELLELLRNHQ